MSYPRGSSRNHFQFLDTVRCIYLQSNLGKLSLSYFSCYVRNYVFIRVVNWYYCWVHLGSYSSQTGFWVEFYNQLCDFYSSKVFQFFLLLFQTSQTFSLLPILFIFFLTPKAVLWSCDYALFLFYFLALHMFNVTWTL